MVNSVCPLYHFLKGYNEKISKILPFHSYWDQLRLSFLAAPRSILVDKIQHQIHPIQEVVTSVCILFSDWLELEE